MNEKGFAKIPGVFSTRKMNDLRAAVFETLLEVEEDRPYADGGRVQWREVDGHKYPALMFWPRLVNETFDGISTDPAIVDIVQDELGDEVRQLNNQLYFRLPGDEDAFDWHQDRAFRQNVRPGIEEAYVQTMVCIDPMTEDNGCLWFIPESHKYQCCAGKPKRTSPRDLPDGMEAEPMNANPGDLLVWSAMVVHGSFPNETNYPRMSYMNGFARAEHCTAWPWYLKNGQVQAADPREIPYK
jgi:hypothetical protein